MLRRFRAALAALLLICSVHAAPAAPAASAVGVPAPLRNVEGISEYRLPNGLQVLLAPDDSKPTTTVNMTYHVGSRYESYGETGMAHLLEHLMFKGSRKYPQVWTEFNRRGLAANGTTSFDRTNYFASFAANPDNLDWYLSWQADAMVNSFIARRDLDSEMTVVRNEMEMGENDPNGIMIQRLMSVMFDWHNYAHEPIGARSDVENVDIERLQAFYRRYYQPDNATLVVSGKFDVARTLATITRAFSAVPKPTRVLPKLYTLDPSQDGERSFVLRRVGGSASVMAGYHVPAVSDPRYPASEALALILGDEPSGRLHQRLVQKQLAAGVQTWSWDLADPGVFVAAASLSAGQDAAAAQRELLAAIESFATEPVTAAELSRAKAKWLKAWNLRYADAQKVGVALSDAVGYGDWRLFFLLRDRIEALTVEQVQAFAVSFFLPSNRTVGQFVPTERPQRAPAPERVDVAQQLESFKPKAELAAAEAFDATPANIDAKTQRFVVSDGAGAGLKAALLPKASRGAVVHASLVLRYGDEKSLSGLGAQPDLLGALLGKGSTRLSRQQVQDRLDELQSELAISGDPGQLNVSITSRRETLPAVLALLGELLREPLFDATVLDEVRRQALAGVEDSRQEPEAVAANVLARHLNTYPRGDVRYARSFDEIKADLEAVNVEQLKALHQRFLGASNALFGAVGDVDVPAVKAALEQAFGGWRSATPYARVPRELQSAKPARLVTPTPDKQNAVLMVSQPLPMNDLDPEYAAFTVANWIVGGGSGDSRLWKRIREKEGLSYGIQSYVRWNSVEPASTWNVWGIFAPQNRAKVETALDEILASALKDGLREEELRSGVRGLLAFRRLSRAQDATLAATLVSNLQLDRTFALAQKVDDAIAATTLAQGNAALRKYLQPGEFTRSLAGDFK